MTEQMLNWFYLKKSVEFEQKRKPEHKYAKLDRVPQVEDVDQTGLGVH